jgi:flagellar motility protein MotE (MotC chaperone)
MREETRRLQELVAAAAVADRKDGSKKSKDSALDTLAKTVRGMKADAAAALLAKLDRGLAAGILGRMRPADAALVLDKMEPAASASLVSLLAGRDRT